MWYIYMIYNIWYVYIYIWLNVVKGTPPLPPSPALSRKVTLFVSSLTIVWGIHFLILFWIWVPFWAPFWQIFPSFCHHFFDHRFPIYFSSILEWILVTLLMFFWYPYRSHMQPSKPSKTFVFTMNFDDLTIQRNIFVVDFPDTFWHCFLISVGIDFGSLLGRLWHKILCLLMIFFFFLMNLWIYFLSILYQKLIPKVRRG